MTIISLKPASIVYLGDKKLKIIRAVDHYKVLLRDINTGETQIAKTCDLSVRKPGVNIPVILLEDLSENLRESALKRLEIIKPLLRPDRTRAMVRERAIEFSVNTATLYRWIKSYEMTKSLVCLAPGYNERGGKGKSRLTPEVETIITDTIEKEYLSEQKKSPKDVFEAIEQMCRRSGLPIPAENTLKKRIGKLSQGKIAKVREGRDAGQRFEAIKGAFPGGNYPLNTIQIDHTPLDVIVVDETYRRPIGRPWLTLAIDVFSRMVYGYFISFDRPSFFSVGQTLLRGILPKDSFLKEFGIAVPWEIQGLPKTIHVDNAGEFNADDFLLFCKEFNIEINWRPVKKPQYGGHIERLGGTLNSKIHTLPGTTFSNIGDRGEYDSEENACFTITELERWFATHVLEVYHNERHSALGISPRQKYEIGVFGDENELGTGLPDIVEDTMRLRLSLLPSFKKTVQREGVTLDGIKYFHDCLRRWVNVKDDKGGKPLFAFRRDPRDISQLYFYEPDLKAHFAIPYRDFRRPPMSIWELRSAKSYLREKGTSARNEELIFQAREKLREMVKEAAQKTKSARRAQEAARHRSRTLKADKQEVPLPAPKAAGTPPQGQSTLEGIFADIKPFTGIEVVSKKED
ncbi:MAG: DDE-type integrase/transposase/recombinase [Geobacter sp.]|nr:MAG: DDE-type integrase/transposase/recombinase [Geobacter sp.]